MEGLCLFHSSHHVTMSTCVEARAPATTADTSIQASFTYPPSLSYPINKKEPHVTAYMLIYIK